MSNVFGNDMVRMTLEGSCTINLLCSAALTLILSILLEVADAVVHLKADKMIEFQEVKLKISWKVA